MNLAGEAIETLRNAAFPVYTIPPSRWQGDVMVGGVWGSSKHPLAITLRYGEGVPQERRSRSLAVVSTGAEGLAHRSPRDRDLRWEHSHRTEIVNFTHGFTDLEERPVAGSERFNADMVEGKLVPKVVYLPSAGPRHLAEPLPFSQDDVIEPVTFEKHPEFACYRMSLSEVEVFAMSWGYEDASVAQLLTTLRPINDDAGLFAEMQAAENEACERIRERKGWEAG